jgi:hypothetical protein
MRKAERAEKKQKNVQKAEFFCYKQKRWQPWLRRKIMLINN